jgi:hypothetical protein
MALAEVERAYSEHNWELAGIKVDPGLDSIRSEPRFQSPSQDSALPSTGCFVR